MSSFGSIFRVTTSGESHCKAITAIIDGVPPNMDLTEQDIQPQLTRRRPGQSKLTTPRDEKDIVTIMSGTERGKTLGTPICVQVKNENVRPQDYKEISVVPRPGHADYTYQQKYGIRASSGGGRSSARETIGRVAAGAIAETWLKKHYNVEIVAWVSGVGDITMPEQVDGKWSRDQVDRLGTLRILRDPQHWYQVENSDNAEEEQKAIDAKYEAKFLAERDPTIPAYQDQEGKCYNCDGQPVNTPADVEKWQGEDIVPVRCPHPNTASSISSLVREVKQDKDSIGGYVTCVIRNVPVGWGEPCFDKLEAKLAHAIMSIPATKGFEVGSGFSGARLRGSQHNDAFVADPNNPGRLSTKTNFAGGILGGISSGQDITFRVAIKPVSTIGQAQATADFLGNPVTLEAKGRHDPCVLPRAVPLVESMSALVLADAALMQQTRCGDHPKYGEM